MISRRSIEPRTISDETIDFTTFEGLKAAGFTGFRSVAYLRDGGLKEVPDAPGVYMVCCEPDIRPQFRIVSVGGRYQDRDPKVPVGELERNWVQGAVVLNIGKAGGASSNITLRERIRLYLAFGAGRRVAHRGGRYIWQSQTASNCNCVGSRHQTRNHARSNDI